MKKWSGKKIVLTVVVVVAVLLVIVTVLVGNFFINYALVPNQGGQDRDPVASELPEGVQAEDQNIEEMVAQQEELEFELADQWLEETEDLTEEVEVESHDGLTLRGNTYLQEDETDDWAVIITAIKQVKKYAPSCSPLLW